MAVVQKTPGGTLLRCRRSSGFTLVEVLIALAILAIALPALMLNISSQINGFSHLRDKSTAHWVAMNKMTELRLQNEYRNHLPKDRKRGDVELLGRQWYWEIDTVPTENKQLLQVIVEVREDNDSDTNPLASAMNYFVLPVNKTQTQPGQPNPSGQPDQPDKPVQPDPQP